MRVQVGPGERVLPGTAEAAARLLDDSRVAAVLVPLRPEGTGALARAAARYVDAWDRRLLHAQTFFAPGARAATREALPGWRAADAAPALARALDSGLRVEALPEAGVATPVARDLGAWASWARHEGEAWGRLAAREPRFAPFSPARSWAGWARHNAAHAHRRAGEALQALRRPDPLAVALHQVREAAWTGGVVRGLRTGGL